MESCFNRFFFWVITLLLLYDTNLQIVKAITTDNREEIRYAMETKKEDVTTIEDALGCIITQYIRDKFGWNRIHRIPRYISMPTTFPSTLKTKFTNEDLSDPRKFYLNCLKIMTELEKKNIALLGPETISEKEYAQKSYCISSAVYCYPEKSQLEIVEEYFNKIMKDITNTVHEYRIKKVNIIEQEEDKEEDLYEKPKYKVAIEEKLKKLQILRKKSIIPPMSSDLEQEFFPTTLEDVPLRKAAAKQKATEKLEYQLTGKASLYNLPIDDNLVSKMSWNFWRSIVTQEERDTKENNIRLLLKSHSFPHNLNNSPNTIKNMYEICQKVLFSEWKDGLVNILNSAINSVKDIFLDIDNSKSEEMSAQYPNPEIDDEKNTAVKKVIFQYCEDSIDHFVGNRQWSKIVERQNSQIYGLPSGRPYRPFKFTFGKTIYEMRENCASVIWDLFSSGITKDLHIEGFRKSGKYDLKLVRNTIESFCHFTSIAYFQGEPTLEEQEAIPELRLKHQNKDSTDKYNDIWNFKSDTIKPPRYQFLAKPNDENVHVISSKASPTGYNKFESNKTLNKRFFLDGRSPRALFGSTRNLDDILKNGVPVGLTVGEIDSETQTYLSLYQDSKPSIVAIQQWNALRSQVQESNKKGHGFTLHDLPSNPPSEWNTPQYNSEKFFFVCVEILNSMLIHKKISIIFPHGSGGNTQTKVQMAIIEFCRDAVNHYFENYEQLFGISRAVTHAPLSKINYELLSPMVSPSTSSQWASMQEQVILDFIRDQPNRINEILPSEPIEFVEVSSPEEFIQQCFNTVMLGIGATPSTIIIEQDFSVSTEEVVQKFCFNASSIYFTAIEYAHLWKESQEWFSNSKYAIYASRGTLKDIPWPPPSKPLAYVGQGQPELFRDMCFSVLFIYWISGKFKDFLIEGTTYRETPNIDIAKNILEDFCTSSARSLYKISEFHLKARENIDIDIMQTLKNTNNYDEAEKSQLEKLENFEYSEKTSLRTKAAKKQWEALKEQLSKDLNMNYVRFLKLPPYDQTLQELWPLNVSEENFFRHCVYVLNELIDRKLALLSSYVLGDRNYVVESFCKESYFYVFSNMKEQDKFNSEINSNKMNDKVDSRAHSFLMDILQELSAEGFPILQWLDHYLNFESQEDRHTLTRAVKWGEKYNNWHFLDLLIRNLDKEQFVNIQKHIQAISPFGKIMSVGLFDKEKISSIQTTWGAIYLQSLRDYEKGENRIIGLVGSTPPESIWPGASGERDFVLRCVESLQKQKINPPYITIKSGERSERGILQIFCEDALDTLMDIQREPQKILSLDFSYEKCINEATRQWQWHHIFQQIDIDEKKLGFPRITGLEPTISHLYFTGGTTPDEIEDKCGSALEELDKLRKIKVLTRDASTFCHDAVKRICKENQDGKSTCTLERKKLEEIILEFYMDSPIGNPLHANPRTRCMRIWTLLKSSIPEAKKKQIIKSGSASMFNSSSTILYQTAIKFPALKEILDVCSPIDTPNHIIRSFLNAIRKLKQISNLYYDNEDKVIQWIKEYIVRYLADERTDAEFTELAGDNVFGDPYSKEDEDENFGKEGILGKGIPKTFRPLTDNEKALLNHKKNMRIDALVNGIVKEVLPILSEQVKVGAKSRLTQDALEEIQKELDQKDEFFNGKKLTFEDFGAYIPISKDDRTRLAGGKVYLPLVSRQFETKKQPTKLIAEIDTRWNNSKKDKSTHTSKDRDSKSDGNQQKIAKVLRNLDKEWISIISYRNSLIKGLPSGRPSEYIGKYVFTKEAMMQRCIQFLTSEVYREQYKIQVKGNMIEKVALIRGHCMGAANMHYSGNKRSYQIARDRPKATYKAGRNIYVKEQKKPLHQVIVNEKLGRSGGILSESELSPEESEFIQNNIPPQGVSIELV
ncbi:hypothetical protein cand_016660 [Cryptosporidium andersoni]|uniref:Uncharacterized protein n=1 Tax=Cryptosporidium andersoni TaxID=117008 RepID=A0A1J4MTD9_9CRYT|nr:hypothetical protein cand_016660 [Cryptosporidium andersoni]